MKIALIVVGKTSQPYLTEGIDEYVSRIKRYMPFELYVIPELKNTRNLTMEQQKNRVSARFSPDRFSHGFQRAKNMCLVF